MVGKKYETGGIAKDGAKMVMAVANAKVCAHLLSIAAHPWCPVRCPSDEVEILCEGAETYAHHRRVLRRGQLRDVRPRVQPPVRQTRAQGVARGGAG